MDGADGAEGERPGAQTSTLFFPCSRSRLATCTVRGSAGRPGCPHGASQAPRQGHVAAGACPPLLSTGATTTTAAQPPSRFLFRRRRLERSGPKRKRKKKEKKKNSAPVPLITWPSHLLASRRAAQRNTLPSALLCPALLCPALPCPARLRTFLLRVDARAPCSQQRLSLQIGLGLPSYRPILTSTCRISSSPISGNSIRVPAGHALASDPRPPLSDSPCKSTRPPPAFCQRRAASMAVRTVSGGAIIETHLSSCTAPAAAAVC